ncbi:MFS transporter, putative [Trichophyton benhamiae CBS 112371]|uniref:MFS transporter, putative n=1 Tax=Arthroderma benhamiae (strain ATCC MYA-4681 / CBS 112371) TaxID=663331 RepID=D4AX99_ARTBC|nr:MFS transporter, putative [Trichophyton benhamiae CBS 112371]EFE32304.1 MFS transporter, putative [Trichophyton benhamiae CBS 112371]
MRTDEEKASKGAADHVDDLKQVTTADVDEDEEFSRQQQRKIIHRIDARLVVICGVGYLVSLMDRTNTSVAAIAGMTKDLGLKIGFRYSIIVLLFFVTYIIAQPIATVAIRKIGPRIFISFIVFTWGVILIGFGFVKDWQQMAGLRALLGFLEAGFFPGTVYLLSTWYCRRESSFDIIPSQKKITQVNNAIDEVQKRYSVFYIIGAVAGSLSGILAFGLSQMEGLQGIRGWRWIFIIEGVISILVAILSYIFLIDFPDRASGAWGFLNEKELAFVVRRVNRDRGDVHVEPFTLGRFLRPALDLKIWGFALIFFCSTTVTYAIAYFLPIILVDGLGFGVGESQCLIAPPYAFAAIVMYTSAYVADKYRIRAPVIAVNSLITLIGLPMVGFGKGSALRYTGVFLATAGANANIPSAMAYQANNIRGQWTRALASATLVGFGGIGGIAGSLVFRSQDAPAYIPGIWAAIT